MMRPRHVVILVQNLPVPLDRRVWQECRALVDAGYRVSVISPKGPGDGAFAELDGVRLYKYDPPPASRGLPGYAREFFACWWATRRFLRHIAANEPIDAIQACNPPDTFFALARPFVRRGVRFVFDQHDLCPEVYAARFGRPNPLVLQALRWLERRTYRLADHVLSTNESFRQVALWRGRRREDDVTVVRSGPRRAMRRGAEEPALRRGRTHLVCYLGIMGPQDGVETVVLAAHELVRRRGRTDVCFALLGFGDCLAELRRLSVRLDVSDAVHFTGQADDAVIGRYLSTAAVGLSPDPPNPMNELCTMNKTLEYMAFELPVVAFDLKETRISAGEAARYVPSATVEAFADAIEELLDDPVARATMGGIGRARVDQGLSWDHAAPRYVSVYDRLLGVRRASISITDDEPAEGDWLAATTPAGASTLTASSNTSSAITLG